MKYAVYISVSKPNRFRDYYHNFETIDGLVKAYRFFQNITLDNIPDDLKKEYKDGKWLKKFISRIRNDGEHDLLKEEILWKQR